MHAYCLLAAAALAAPLHQAGDLDELRNKLGAATDADARIAVLEEIAALHVDDRSDGAITEAVVEALGDGMTRVATRAAELLGTGLNEEIALDGLVEAASRLADARARLGAEVQEFAARATKEGQDTGSQLMGAFVRLRELKFLVQQHADYKKALAEALLPRRDDRCATGLAYLLADQLHEQDALPIVEGLLALGTRPAIESVVEVFEAHDKEQRKRKKQRSKLARQKLAKEPDGWGKSTKEWKEQERARVAVEVKAFDMTTASGERWLKKVAKRLRTFASRQDLPDPPSTVGRALWVSWWRKAKLELPTSLEGEVK